MVDKDRKTERDPWPPAARMVVAVLVVGMGLMSVTGAVGFIRAGTALHKVDVVSKCNADWKKAYRDAQPPRIAANTKNLESQLKFYLDLRTLERSAVPGAPGTLAQQLVRQKQLDASITAAYNATAKQLNSQAANAYPTDECGRAKQKKAAAPHTPLPPSKEKSDGDKESVDSGTGSGVSGSGLHGSERVGVGSAAGGNGGDGGVGGGNGQHGGKPPNQGGSGSTDLPGLVGRMLSPLCSVLLITGCGPLGPITSN